jgi:GDP-L-fucose synthase
METYEKKGIINVGSSQEISIRNLAELLKNITEFKGDLIFNDNRQDGVMRKIMDNSNIFSTGWKPNVTIENGIAEMYKWFLKNNNN